ncbi:MAG: hypothetical protein ACLFVU_02760 [Phycisphaerae bacterium]
MIIGTSAYSDADVNLMKQAGITHLRQGFGYPWAKTAGGEPAERYVNARAAAVGRREQGFELMGITPLFGHGVREPVGPGGKLELVWKPSTPAWMGEYGSDEFIENYEMVCRFLAEQTRGVVDLWQIANELDLNLFAGPLKPAGACELILAAARGLKAGNPDCTVGHNCAGTEMAYFFCGRLFADADTPLDYCGIDGYYGTWDSGGPNSWAGRIAELYELTGKPVLINEWGYSSAGGVMTQDEAASEPWPCELKKWRFGWDGGHTPQVQAEFVRQAFAAFRQHREKLMGLFFYRWEDQAKCWQCGQPDCPAETAWGLVDRNNRPKPAWQAFAAGVRELRET